MQSLWATRSWKTQLATLKILLKHELTVPVSADEKLEEEQKGIIEFMKREAGRSEELTSILLKLR